MSLSEPKIPSTEAKQNHPCIKDAVVVAESSLQDHGDQEEATFQFDPGPRDPEELEAAVPEDSNSSSSTESDSEEFSGGGYTLLPQEPEEEKPSDWTTSGGVNRGQLEPHSDTRTDGSSAAVGPVSRLEECEWRVIVSISRYRWLLPTY